jgi:anti-anti-sigma factor
MMADYQVVERADDYALLELRGDLMGDLSIDRLKETLEEHFVDDGVKRIRVDLSKLNFVSLEGVGMLLALWRESADRGKRLLVENPVGQVKEKLQVVGVIDLLEMP